MKYQLSKSHTPKGAEGVLNNDVFLNFLKNFFTINSHLAASKKLYYM